MSPDLLRELAWWAPTMVTGVLWMGLARRTARDWGALLVTILWTSWTLTLLQQVAPQMGWWEAGPAVDRIPVELTVGWVLLWGPLPHLLLARLPLLAVAALAVVFDLALMPMFDPLVHLREGWLVGEALAVVAVLLPAQWLARKTVDGTALYGRVSLHLAWFIPIAVVGLPRVIHPEGAWGDLLAWGAWPLQIGLVLLLWGLSAVLEFAQRGGGTPLPFDPPRRLVQSGPYRYVRNPMQVALGAWFGLLALVWGAPWLWMAVVVTVAYGEGAAAYSEGLDMSARHGERWGAYAKEVRRWRPRWRPWVPQTAVLYTAEDCGVCREVGDVLFGLHPTGLERVAAEVHPTRALTRITYDPRDGTPEVEGVWALARALEHVHLGWAWFSFALRVPGAASLLQLLVDAVGGGPRAVAWRGATAPESPALPERAPG